MDKCPQRNCFAPDSACDDGEIDLAQCRHWQARGDKAPVVATTDDSGMLLPWTGSALGPAHFAFVAGRVKPMVVGILGPYNAGKTTLLAAWYLLVGRGRRDANQRRFAGSYTLAGWESVASAMRWREGPQPPTFPPHTPSGGRRTPGLLHITFRDTSEHPRSYLFADAPGEWFDKWATDRNAIDAEGARWIATHGDVFLLVADREALSGPDRGVARKSLQLLAQRLAHEREGRPVALVWTKADVAILPEIEQAVRDAVLGRMPDAQEFSVSVLSGTEDKSDCGQGFLDLLDWTLERRRARTVIPTLAVGGTDPLFVYGTRVS